MKKLLTAMAVVMMTAATSTTYGQGQVVFANRQTGVFDAPVTIQGTNPFTGPGSTWSAQLYMQGAGGTLTPLVPVATFLDAKPGATGSAALANRYWGAQTVDVPGVQPGANATFVVRVWQTSFGSYDAAIGNAATWGESAPFTVAVGGGTLPPANLTTLQAFTIALVPEPSVIVLGILGAAVLALRRRGKEL